MSSPLHVVTAGHGPRLVLVHGSAADHATWTIQLATWRDRYAMVAYDRRGTGRSAEAAADPRALTVEDHAADLVALVEAQGAPVLAMGSSFGGVVVLEAARRAPAVFRGIVLLEPPLPASDAAPGSPDGFLESLDARAEAQGGAAASELFLRTVLGDAAYEKMPRTFQARAQSMWPALRGDCGALAAYRVRYATLGEVQVPALLAGGDRSAPYFRPTLDALAAALPRARRATLPGAGHMMHADAPRGLAAELADFVATLP